MANIPLYGQNKDGDALNKASNAFRGALDVIVAGDNSQYSPGKDELCRTYASHHANGMDITLPSVDKSDAGLWVKIEVAVTVTASDLVAVTAASGDLLEGSVYLTKATDAVANQAEFAADESNDLIFSMNGSTTGGLIGSWAKFTVNENGYWTVEGQLMGSGTLATPFS
tara:strand:- start:3540 stop:4046 length:507 start_codon:yes stop_codon:yes gene_type:complete